MVTRLPFRWPVTLLQWLMSLVWLLCSATSVGDLMYGDYALEISANGSMARGVASTISVGNLVAEATSLTTSSSSLVTGPPAPPTLVLSHWFWWFA